MYRDQLGLRAILRCKIVRARVCVYEIVVLTRLNEGKTIAAEKNGDDITRNLIQLNCNIISKRDT